MKTLGNWNNVYVLCLYIYWFVGFMVLVDGVGGDGECINDIPK